MKKYIVTGSTGYIGYVLVHKLIEKGYKPVKILIRNEKALKRFEHLDIEYALGDITDQDFLNEHITKDSVVFHLAGMIDIGGFNKDLIYKTNIGGTKNIVEACKINNAEKLIYVSSVSAIVPPKKGIEIKEPTFFNSKKVAGDYAKTKAVTSEYVLNESREGKLNAVVCYPSAVIGPYDYNVSSVGDVVLNYMNNNFKAYTKGMYNFVDVRDVCDALISCYEKGKSGHDYILSGETITLKEMFVILNKILEKDKFPVTIPLWFLKLIAPLIQLYYLARKETPILTRTSLKILNQNSVFDNSKSINNLDFNPRSAKESLTDMVNWFKENKDNLLR